VVTSAWAARVGIEESLSRITPHLSRRAMEDICSPVARTNRLGARVVLDLLRRWEI